MEYIEIIISDIKKKYIDSIIKNDFEISNEKIISSHFYNKKDSKDIEFHDISNFENYYKNNGTGNIFARELFLGSKIYNVVIVISFDEKFGDIVLNFEEKEVLLENEEERNNHISIIFKKLYDLIFKYELKEIKIGYEPAIDDEMLLAIINKNGINLINKSILLPKI